MIRTPRQLQLRQLLRHSTAPERAEIRKYLDRAFDPLTAFILAIVAPRAARNIADRMTEE